MSNENEYQNYDFCKDVKCVEFDHENKYCSIVSGCIKTAKEFHGWLNIHDYKIVKREQIWQSLIIK